MNSGRYDRLIQILRPHEADDGTSIVTQGLIEHGKPVPARFKPGLGKERFANAQNSESAPAVYFVRYHPDFSVLPASWLLRDGVTEWQIISARWDGNLNSEIEISVSVRK